LNRRPGREKRKKSRKPRSTCTSSEEFNEALQSTRDIDDAEGWGETEISDSALEDTEDAAQASSWQGTKTNDQFLQTAFRSAANSILATVVELPRGPRGRGGGFIKKSGYPDALGTLSPIRLPQPGPVQPILPMHTPLEQTESKTMFNFQARLTFGLQPGREVNVAILFPVSLQMPSNQFQISPSCHTTMRKGSRSLQRLNYLTITPIFMLTTIKTIESYSVVI